MTTLSSKKGYCMNSSTAANPDTSQTCRLAKDLELLRHTELLGGVNLDMVKLFAYLSVRRTYRAGDLLIEQNQKADRAFILISGDVDVSVEHRNKMISIQTLKQDDFFGELALLAQFDWFFSVRATTDVEVLIIHRHAFQKVIDKFPDQKDLLIERVIQLRVNRLIDQTSLMLDNFIAADQAPATSLI